ncbi:MAG: D-alanine--D-alanine ligase [Anaerolineales bacterium]|nr:D-alanine--D-alanine ligase [Anaerolineales bacterium]
MEHVNEHTGKSPLRVGVIFGGRSGEHEVSLMSARSVLAALQACNAEQPGKYEAFQIGITHEGRWLCSSGQAGEDVLTAMQSGSSASLTPAAILGDPSFPGLFAIQGSTAGDQLSLIASLDVVFPVLHGTFGEDGTLQGLLEMADVAYVGAGVLGSALGMDKGVFQAVMRADAIPVLETAVILRSQIDGDMAGALAVAEKVAPYPLFIKPANLGSSVGVSKCCSRSDLMEGLMEAARFDRRVLIQRGLNAREIEVSVLGNDEPIASVPGEVIPSRDFYSYEAKYIDNASELLIPAPIPPETAEEARRIAVQAYKAIDCAGMARVDFLLDKDSGGLFLNEVNTIPGFTQISMYPKLWDASGIPYPALVERLIELAFERKMEKDRTERRYQG